MKQLQTGSGRYALLFPVLILLLVLGALASCETYPQRQKRRFACSIKADGSDFRRLKMDQTGLTIPQDHALQNFPERLLRVMRENSDRVILFYGTKLISMELTGEAQQELLKYEWSVRYLAFDSIPNRAYYSYYSQVWQLDLLSGDKTLVFDGGEGYITCLFGDYTDNSLNACGEDNLYIIKDGNVQVIDLPQYTYTAKYIPALNSVVYVNFQDIWLLDLEDMQSRILIDFNTDYEFFSPILQPIGDGSRFLTVKPSNWPATLDTLVVFDINTGLSREITLIQEIRVDDYATKYIFSLCGNQRYVFYEFNDSIWRYDLETSATDLIFTSSPDNQFCRNFDCLSSSIDGEYLYFICDIYDY